MRALYVSDMNCSGDRNGSLFVGIANYALLALMSPMLAQWRLDK